MRRHRRRGTDLRLDGTAADILIIDPESATASRTPIAGVGPTSPGKWVMGDIVHNKFYGIPYGAEEIIVVEFVGGGSGG